MSQSQQNTIDISNPEKIKDALHKSLGNLGILEECALLDYPDHPNIGDHLIWLGEILYLTDVLKTKINYVSSIKNFSAELMEKNVGKSPILLHGGGNLGDLWQNYQIWREDIISKYRDRKIVILPQSIYFNDEDNLKKAANIFNSHPDLTIFTRENYSYEIAVKYFYNCRVINSPDSAFQMINMPLLSFKYKYNGRRPILYLCREDSELNSSFAPQAINISNSVAQDWINSQQWIYRGREKFWELQGWYRHIPGVVMLIREGWQRRGFTNPQEWMIRHRWERYHPYVDKFTRIPDPFIHQFSWSLFYTGMHQLSQARLVITNRLHAHILCILLGIPNILLPNSYYKNESFYTTWTYQLSFCKFVKYPFQIQDAIKELLPSYSK